MIKRLTIVLSIFSVGCGSAPKKPPLEICIADVPSNEVICGMTTNSTWESVSTANNFSVVQLKDLVLNHSLAVTRYPIKKIDKGICLDQLNSNQLIDYIHDLENYIKYKCKAGLNGESISNSGGT